MAASLSIVNDPIAVPRGQLRGRRRVIATVTFAGTWAANSDLAVTAADFNLNSIEGALLLGVTDGSDTIIGAVLDIENLHLLPVMADGALISTSDNVDDCAVKMLVWGQ